MEIHRTEIYEQFQCTGGACKEHCCGGWRILLDAEALARFRAEKGLTGLRLRSAMRGADSRWKGFFGIGGVEDGDVVFNKSCGECLFHNRKGLCALQLRFGHDYLPVTCRVFPRERRNYGPFAEEHLDLSCIAAAGLLVQTSRFGEAPDALGDDSRSGEAPDDPGDDSWFGEAPDDPGDDSRNGEAPDAPGGDSRSGEEGGKPEILHRNGKIQRTIRLKEVDEPVPYGRYGNNEDESYLHGLVGARSKLIDLISTAMDAESLQSAMGEAVRLCAEWQERSVAGMENPFAEEAPGDKPPDNDATNRQEGPAESTDKDTETASPDSTERNGQAVSLLPLPIGKINLWINTCLYEEDPRRRNPFLHKLCRLYFRAFDKLNEITGQKRLETLFARYLGTGKQNTERQKTALFRDYLVYHLYRNFLETYEDYSFLRKIYAGVIGVNILVLFEALWEEAYGELSVEDEAHIIAVYEKRVYHSSRLEADMYRLVDGTLQEG